MNNGKNKFAVPDVKEGGWFGLGKKRFANPPSFTGWKVYSPLSLLVWAKLTEKDDSAVPCDAVLKKTLPVLSPPKFRLDVPFSATWLGHATVFGQLEGKISDKAKALGQSSRVSFITDPVWANELSPYRWLKSFPRFRPPPSSIEGLPPLDFGVISHSHYDHFDVEAVRAIAARFPTMRWFVPLGLKSDLVEKSGVLGDNVVEMGWGEKKSVTFGNGEGDKKTVDIWCLPAQHTSQREALDKDTTLWSGWAVIGANHRFYFPGDTGFCGDEFRKIGEQLGPFDLAAIPIGCYKPDWFMKPQHISPEEAVQVHKLVRARHSIGIHWGTYRMGSFEHYLEPREKLLEAVKNANLGDSVFNTIEHGETLVLDSSESEK